MLETRFVASHCNKCDAINEVPLSCFLDLHYKFKKHIVVACKFCEQEFVVVFNDKTIH